MSPRKKEKVELVPLKAPKAIGKTSDLIVSAVDFYKRNINALVPDDYRKSMVVFLIQEIKLLEGFRDRIKGEMKGGIEPKALYEGASAYSKISKLMSEYHGKMVALVSKMNETPTAKVEKEEMEFESHEEKDGLTLEERTRLERTRKITGGRDDISRIASKSSGAISRTFPEDGEDSPAMPE